MPMLVTRTRPSLLLEDASSPQNAEISHGSPMLTPTSLVETIGQAEDQFDLSKKGVEKMGKAYKNPIRRGFFPDPSVIRVGEDYYMVNSSFQYFPAIPISHSRDLIHWELIGHAVTDSSYLDLSDIPDSHGIWAPDIEYINGRFYVIATLMA